MGPILGNAYYGPKLVQAQILITPPLLGIKFKAEDKAKITILKKQS